MVPATSEPTSRRKNALVQERRGHITFDDTLRQTFHDGCLADTGFADQGRVILGAAGEDLDDAFDLFFTSNDRIELAILGVAVKSTASWSTRGVLAFLLLFFQRSG